MAGRKTDDELYAMLCRAAGRRVVLVYAGAEPDAPDRGFLDRFRLPGDRDMTFREALLVALRNRGIEP